MEPLRAYWCKLEIADNTSSVDEIEYMRFLHSASSVNEDFRISNFHAVGKKFTDTAVSIHEDGYIKLHRGVNSGALPAVNSGGILYVNDFGRLGYKSSTQNIELGTKDFSWCGGFLNSSNTAIWLPVNTTAESGVLASYHKKLMMRDGKFQKVILKSSTDGGATTVKLYVNGSSAETCNAVWVDDNTVGDTDYRFTCEANFYINPNFTSGQTVSIEIDTTNNLGSQVMFATEILYTS